MRKLAIGAFAAALVTLFAVETANAQFYGGRGRGTGVAVSTPGFSFSYGRPSYGWYGYGGYYWGGRPAYWSYPGYYYGYGPQYYGGYYNYGPAYMQDGSDNVDTAYNPGTSQGSTAFYYDPAQRDRQVELRIVVPDPMAQVTIEDRPTMQRGNERTFISPPLEPGRDYKYTIKASWPEQGKEVTREKQVDVKPGQVVTVNFREQQGEQRDQTAIDRQVQPIRPVAGAQDPIAVAGNRDQALTGKIVRVEGNQLFIKDMNTNVERSFRLTDGAVVTLNGQKADLQQLKPDMRVTITSDPGALGMASRIEAKSDSANDR